MEMVKAMTITVDSLLARPKLDYDVGYDAAVKGVSVVVCVSLARHRFVCLVGFLCIQSPLL